MKALCSFAFSLLLLASPALGAGFAVVPLNSDQPGVAPHTDAELVNAWGTAHGTDTSPLWVSANGTGKSTVYNRSTGNKNALTVTIPGGSPTGIVFVKSGFLIGGVGPTFMFANEAGQISGWSSGTNAVVAVDHSGDGSVYKGLAIDNTNHLLFAADFARGRVEIYDTNFNRIKTFKDSTLPKGYAPFNVAVLNGKVYVAFARREPGGTDEVAKPHFGFVDVFTTAGVLETQLIVQGLLNAPWGLTIAPAGFGTLEGALLVGNFGDGRVNAYNATTGNFIQTLAKPNGKPLKIDGLWALDAGPTSSVTYTAGPALETHGVFGLIQAQ